MWSIRRMFSLQLMQRVACSGVNVTLTVLAFTFRVHL